MIFGIYKHYVSASGLTTSDSPKDGFHPFYYEQKSENFGMDFDKDGSIVYQIRTDDACQIPVILHQVAVELTNNKEPEEIRENKAITKLDAWLAQLYEQAA